MINSKPVRVVWNRLIKDPPFRSVDDPLSAEEVERLSEMAQSKHPAFSLTSDLIIELPTRDWDRADLLVYLSNEGWLVRRQHDRSWYVDIGLLHQAKDDLYLWTDLWLDVVTDERATHYQLLDADEFAEAIRKGQISTQLVAQALESLHKLIDAISGGRFPPPEVRQAEELADTVLREESP